MGRRLTKHQIVAVVVGAVAINVVILLAARRCLKSPEKVDGDLLADVEESWQRFEVAEALRRHFRLIRAGDGRGVWQSLGPERRLECEEDALKEARNPRSDAARPRSAYEICVPERLLANGKCLLVEDLAIGAVAWRHGWAQSRGGGLYKLELVGDTWKVGATEYVFDYVIGVRSEHIYELASPRKPAYRCRR